MLSPDAVCALAAVFILAMAAVRTRLQYARRGTPGRRLTSAGVGYFASLGLLLLAGWFAGPLITREVFPFAPLSAALVRGVWFLAVYYLSIPFNRALLARGRPVFA
jgi:hypothetical protein